MRNKEIAFENFLTKIKKYSPNVVIDGEFVNGSTPIKCHCKICNQSWERALRVISASKSNYCPVCKNYEIVFGFNDLYTLRPDLIMYAKNKDDFKAVSVGSSKYIDCICPNCKNEKQVQISNLTRQGFKCDYCSDNISFPNKLSRRLLNALNVYNHIIEYSPKWAKNKSYDNYFEKDGNKYVLEMDGAFHYITTKISNVNIVKDADKYKDELAKKHDIEVIRIDCNTEDVLVIKNNIINSKLNELYDLTKIDWNKLIYDSCSNLFYQFCNYYNNISKDLTYIAKELLISRSTAKSYAHRGHDLGIFVYDLENSRQIKNQKIKEKNKLQVYVEKDNEFYMKFPSVADCIHYFKYNDNKMHKMGVDSIYDCLKGRRNNFKGFSFYYF